MSIFMPILQINTVAIILMLITIFSIIKFCRSAILADRLFFMLTCSILLTSFLEIICTFTNAIDTPNIRIFNVIFTSILFACTSIPSFLWASYVHCKVFKDRNKYIRESKYLALPVIIVSFFNIVNLYSGVFFVIDENNIFTPGKYFLVILLAYYIYVIYVTVILLKEKKTIERKILIPITSYIFLPMTGLLFQILPSTISMIWIWCASSIIIMYNYVQNDYTLTDWLTGIYNRKYLDIYLKQMCSRKINGYLIGFMIDIDKFKHINDTYGHLLGDEALKNSAKILRHACGRKASIARYAGDEFVVVIEAHNKNDVNKYLNKINEEVAFFNRISKEEYTLSFSVGHAIFRGSNVETADDFLSRMDKRMYAKKHTRNKELV